MKIVALAIVMVLSSTWCSAQLKVLSPNGGEVLNSGKNVTIRWAGTSYPDSVMIEYSTDAGSSWIEIVRNLQSTSYQWKVPFTGSQTCLLRITGPLKTLPRGTVYLRDTTRPGTYSHNSIDLTNDASLAVIADEDGHVTVFNAVTGGTDNPASYTRTYGAGSTSSSGIALN
ncbi:MAG: hypothetical protein NTX15_02380 [Candidatus Kapabacteria bacterium]|nr:hypothetical protein [Candidatus Kapabacteria bacterium]